jgi:hypothetical protein
MIDCLSILIVEDGVMSASTYDFITCKTGDYKDGKLIARKLIYRVVSL